MSKNRQCSRSADGTSVKATLQTSDQVLYNNALCCNSIYCILFVFRVRKNLCDCHVTGYSPTVTLLVLTSFACQSEAVGQTSIHEDTNPLIV